MNREKIEKKGIQSEKTEKDIQKQPWFRMLVVCLVFLVAISTSASLILPAESIIRKAAERDPAIVLPEAEPEETSLPQTYSAGSFIYKVNETEEIKTEYTEEAELSADAKLQIKELDLKEPEYEGTIETIREDLYPEQEKTIVSARVFQVHDPENKKIKGETTITYAFLDGMSLQDDEELIILYQNKEGKYVIPDEKEQKIETKDEKITKIILKVENPETFAFAAVKDPEVIESGEQAEEALAEEESAVEETVQEEPAEEEADESEEAADPEEENVSEEEPTTLTAEENTYTVTLTYGPDAGIPEDSTLYVRELTENTRRYNQYLDQAGSEVKEITYARFFDIRILDSERNEIEPQGKVEVRITSTDEKTPPEAEVTAVHFRNDDETEILPTEDNNTEEIRFETESFSIYGILYTVDLHTEYISSSGHAYDITVTYTEDAGIPEQAKLEVQEITAEEELYDDYVSRAEDVLGLQDEIPSYIRLFDISILDENEEKVTIAAPVEVRIELADKDSEDNTRVVHFAGGTETADVISDVKIDATESDGVTVSFEAPGFSVYAFVDGREPAAVEPQIVHTLAELSGQTDVAMVLSVMQNNRPSYFTNVLNGNKAFIENTDVNNASEWYFESAGQNNRYYIYTMVEGQKKYVTNPSGNLAGLSDTPDTTYELEQAADGKFNIKINGQNKWLQHSGSGNGIRFWTDKNNAANSQVTLTYKSSLSVPDDPYDLDGMTYGIAYQDNSAKAAGLIAEELSSSRLVSEEMLIRPDVLTNDGILLVAENSEITDWTFENVTQDKYYLKSSDGRYLTMSSAGLTLSDTPDPVTSLITVIPGTGQNAGKWHFKQGSYYIDLPGTATAGFGTATNANKATTWMNIVERSVLNDDDFNLYTARKVSVSDTEHLTNGQKVIVYTRIWNADKGRYEFYAVDHNGTLIPCYDVGDSIEWVGSKVNTAEWEFTEYYESDGSPNYYYDLQNVQYGEYLAPYQTSGQILASDAVGINLNGRRYGRNYSTIIAWDDESYAYSGLKVENGHVVPCSLDEAEDFYFAIVTEKEEEDELTEVETLDGTMYGVTMSMIDFNNPIVNNRDSGQTNFFGRDTDTPGLLSSNLDENGYPIRNDGTGRNLAELFDDMTPVNKLFIKSIYNESGYLEYDSTQNFAHLNDDGTFTVYDQIAAFSGDGSTGVTRLHGQFMPYDNIEAGNYAHAPNGDLNTNQTDVLGNPLPDTDPRKGETLYNLGTTKTVDYFFGMEMTAHFTQTESGVDAWGHDIIFEFSGDDDFWFYVDGELVLDLGGVHSAMVGSINFRTGVVTSSRGNSTLYEIFRNNYIARGLPEAEIQQKLDEIFKLNDEGNYVFKDYTNHEMKMFYMERGAGSSNLHMRFNLAAVKPGTFQLSKKLSGTEDTENDLIEFPYQIYYRTTSDSGTTWHLLNNNNKVYYVDTTSKVKFKSSFRPAGGTQSYQNVFFLKPGETAEVGGLPVDVIDYKVVECGVNPDVYDEVKANGEVLSGTDTVNMVQNTARQDYETSAETLENRPKLDFDNHVAEGAMRTMEITKRLYDSDGITPLHYPDNPTLFKFRLYLGDENTDDDNLPAANMYPYCVKDPDGNYCRWDTASQKFISIGKSDYSTLTAEEKEQVTFITSMNGTISKIPADHTIEVRNLIIGTKFKLEERDYEIPKGYTLRLEDGYTRLDHGTEEKYGTTPITGEIVKDNDPDLEVRNQKGWGLTVDKIWTDKDFMESHDPIYTAVYVRDPQTGQLSLLEDSVRQILSPETSVYYFFGNLQNLIPFANYEIREVTLEGDFEADDNGVVTGYTSVTPIENGETLTTGGTPVGGEHKDDYEYEVLYEQGEETLHNENVRTDTVTNSRPGVVLYKTDMEDHYLEGAVFTLTDEDGQDVAAESYTSGADGRITIAYLSPGDYTLTETEAPDGFVVLDTPMTITITEDGEVQVSGISERMYTLDTDPSGEMTAVITIKNRRSALQVRKIDSATDQGLQDVHFALYKQVIDKDGHKVKDYQPISGFENIVTDVNGILTEITFQLKAGTYYLTETQTLPDYILLDEDLCFTLGLDGTVTINSEGHQDWLTTEVDPDTQMVSYLITIPNSRDKYVSVWKTDIYNRAITTGADFELYLASEFDDETNTPLPDAEVIASGTTGESGILELGPLPNGEYRLLETRAPDGYSACSKAVVINVDQNRVTAMQNEYASLVVQKNDPDGYWVSGQNDLNWQVCVWNYPGFELPKTGGEGTAFFYVSGLLLVLAAGYLLIRRRQTTE